MPTRVLLALADDPGALASALRAAGHAVELVAPARVRASVAASRPGVCVLDLAGPDLPPDLLELAAPPTGTALVVRVPPPAPFAGEALRRGVDAVLPREAAVDWVVAEVQAAVERRTRAAELAARRQARLGEDAVLLAGRSAAARRLRESLERIASTPRTTVLVAAEAEEEAGCLARLIHGQSARAQGPLLEVEVGGRDDADEAEALGAADGPLARAEGGTCVLHRVERLGPLAQLALARALERRGSDAGWPDVRVVATGIADLDQEVLAGRFREDLLYRLNVLTLRVPTLAERSEDVEALVRGLAERAATPLSGEAVDALARQPWPGGVRQLRLAVAAAGARNLAGPPPAPAAGPGGPLPDGGSRDAIGGAPGALLSLPARSLRAAEEALIRQVLAETGGNKLRSAEILGIHRTTLYHKLRDYGIDS